jgi:hypothetical protein
MMFLDYLFTIPNKTTGMDDILVQSATAMSSIVPLLLLFVFFVIVIGGIWRQSLRTGTADYSMWFVIASLVTFLLALMMSVIEGLIRIEYLVIVVVITIFSGIWFFLDRDNSGV